MQVLRAAVLCTIVKYIEFLLIIKLCDTSPCIIGVHGINLLHTIHIGTHKL